MFTTYVTVQNLQIHFFKFLSPQNIIKLLHWKSDVSFHKNVEKKQVYGGSHL